MEKRKKPATDDKDKPAVGLIRFDVPLVKFRRDDDDDDDDEDDDDDKDKDRDYTATLMTQTVIPRHFALPDGTFADELVLSAGGHIPRSKKIPLLDTHDRSSIRSQVGSFVNLRRDGTSFVGETRISAAEPDVKTKIKEQHYDSLSLGMRPRPGGAKFLAAGKSRTYGSGVDQMTVVGGDNGTVVYTDWDFEEASLTSVPANEYAKIQHALLNTFVIFERDEDPAGDPMDEAVKDTQKIETVAETVKPAFVQPPVDVNAAVKDALAKHKQFVATVRDECRRFNLDVETADELSNTYSDTASVNKAILDKLDERQRQTRPAISVSVKADGSERRYNAQKWSLVYSLIKNEVSPKALEWASKEYNLEKEIDPQFVGMSLSGHSRLLLEGQNVNLRGLRDGQVIERAVRFGQEAYISSGSLSNLLSDAINKVGQVGYQDAVVTFDQVGKQLPSVDNLKNVYNIRLSGLGFYDAWLEDTEPLQATALDARQTIKVQPWAKDFIIPWHIYRNDDLGMLGEAPLKMGRAARRTMNREFWACVTGNQTMEEDSNPLFYDRTVGNNIVTANAGTVSTAEINSMQQLMSAQTDKDGALIGLEIKFLIGPPGQERSIKQLCGSVYDPNASVAEIPNVYKGLLVPVIEPLLGSTSQTVYYGFADKANSPVAYGFLTGEESPFLKSFIREKDDAICIRGRQTAFFSAIDYRTAVQHN